MAFSVTKPDKYAKCICCKSGECLTEYQFGNEGIKSSIVLCCNCVANMYRESVKHEEDGDKSIFEMFRGEKHLNPNYNNETTKGYVVPNDILGLWEQTICEIRAEIKSWHLKGPYTTDYAKGLCDKLEQSICGIAGGSYPVKYQIEEAQEDS